MCLSSATRASSPATATDDGVSLPSGGGTGSGSGASAADVGDSGGGSGAAGGGNGGAADGGGNGGAADGGKGGQQGIDTANAIIIEGDEPVPDEDDQPCGKRQKRCTSDVWQYFTKKRVVIEDNGKTYVQMWAHCKWPRCKHKGRCESNYVTP